MADADDSRARRRSERRWFGSVGIFLCTSVVACHDYSGTFAIRNTTADSVSVRVETSGHTYQARECEGAGKALAAGPQTVAAGVRICFDGPVEANEYSAPDDVALVHVDRGEQTCFERRGPLKDLFVDEGYFPTLRVDDVLCPPPKP